MDLTLNEDQEALRHSVRAVLAGECPPAVARDALTDPECWRPLWKTAVDLGWTALALQEEAAGLGLVELVVVIEDCGAALLPAPLLSTAGLAGGALAAAGTATYALRQELAEGAVGALIASQPGARLPGPAAAYDGRVLRGTGGQVIDADRADLIVVLAEDLSGDNILAVVRPGPGVDILPSHAVDGARPLADVILDVMPELVVPCSLAEALAVPLTAAAADLLGVAARALDLAVGHALDREQFGRKIGSFQAVKHRLADTWVAVESARSLVYGAAAAGNEDAAHCWRSARLAKAAAGEAALTATRTAVQVHGAIAQTWEHDLHLWVRRAWQSYSLLGDSRALYRAVGAEHVGRRTHGPA